MQCKTERNDDKFDALLTCLGGLGVGGHGLDIRAGRQALYSRHLG